MVACNIRVKFTFKQAPGKTARTDGAQSLGSA